MPKVVLASRNKKKLAELQEIFSSCGLELVSALDYPELEDVEETGFTFADNAALKAEYIVKTLNLPAIADDSGLVVDVLDGAPGVRSARFAGEGASDAANNLLLLDKLREVADKERTARFKCVIAFARPGEDTVFFEGETEGLILQQAAGEGGFGYDPLFYSLELNKSFAEAAGAEKNSISHRGRAVNKLISVINDLI